MWTLLKWSIIENLFIVPLSNSVLNVLEISLDKLVQMENIWLFGIRFQVKYKLESIWILELLLNTQYIQMNLLIEFLLLHTIEVSEYNKYNLKLIYSGIHLLMDGEKQWCLYISNLVING